VSKNGKTYKFGELADKIPTLDPRSFIKRVLYGDHD
jgi:hypothetical protein